MTGQSILVRRQREETLQGDRAAVLRFRAFNQIPGCRFGLELCPELCGQQAKRNPVLPESPERFLELSWWAWRARRSSFTSATPCPSTPPKTCSAIVDQAFPNSNARVESLNYDITADFKEFTARCNANEVTLYPVNARSFETTIATADKASDLSVSHEAPAWSGRRRGPVPRP